MIRRNPQQAASRRYDLIIIGAGIYGIAAAYLAARCRLAVLLLEQGDFGHATSFNHLRIVHGGFRYLQSMDLPRFYESVGERRWFLRHFKGLVRPMPCMMPLYNRGIQRVPVLRLALGLNDLLSAHRNEGVAAENHLAGGRVVSREEALRIFPGLISQGLQGAAIWQDAIVDAPQRLHMEWLRHACRLGADALNHCRAMELILSAGTVAGIVAQDLVDGQEHRFQAPVVLNAAGPWCRELAAAFDRDHESLFRPSLACNVLFDRPALSSHALALSPPRPGGRTCFLPPWNGRLLAGTIHEPWNQTSEPPPGPPADILHRFIEDLNLAVPGLNLTEGDILQLNCGLLPAKEAGSARISVREVLLDHGAEQGPRGLWSVSGVKFTTARLVAEKILGRIFPDVCTSLYASRRDDELAAAINSRRGLLPTEAWQAPLALPWRQQLEEIIAEESVVHLDDLVQRRCNLGDHPPTALTQAPLLAPLFSWDESRMAAETARLAGALALPLFKPGSTKATAETAP